MIVIDASAALEVLLRTPVSTKIAPRLFDPQETLHAPHLIDIEIAQVLRRHAASGQVTEDSCLTALNDWRDIALVRYPHQLFLDRIWELRQNFSAYDAAYVALAEALAAPLLTHDRRLANAAARHAQVEFV